MHFQTTSKTTATPAPEPAAFGREGAADAAWGGAEAPGEALARLGEPILGTGLAGARKAGCAARG